PSGLGPDALVDGDRQRQAERQRDQHVAYAVAQEIAVGDLPALMVPEVDIVVEPDEVVLRQKGAARDRDPAGPEREAEDVDHAGPGGGREDQPGPPRREALPPGPYRRRGNVCRHGSPQPGLTSAPRPCRPSARPPAWASSWDCW